MTTDERRAKFDRTETIGLGISLIAGLLFGTVAAVVVCIVFW